MSIDLSKIANQLTSFSKSPQARRANEYSLKTAFMMQEMEAEEQRKADEAFINTTNTIQSIENTALKMAWREKDKAVLQENYKEHADNLKKVILEDYGGDITRFYQQGGRRELQMFAMNVLNNDKAQLMAKNTGEFAKYLEAMEGGSGDGRNIFNSVHDKALQYQRGAIDDFSYGVDMIEYKKPTQDFMKTQNPSLSQAEMYLNFGGNYNAAILNYRNEFGKSQEEANNLSDEELIEYVRGYVGGDGRTNNVRNMTPKLSNEIHTIMQSMGNVNASDLQTLENLDTNYKKQLGALSEYAFYNPGEEVEGNVYGKEVFNDYLVELAGTFIDPDFTRANGFTDDGTVTLNEVDHSSGSMYDVVGNKLEEGVTFGQGMFNSNQFEILGAMMGYKTLGGDERVLTYDQLEEINKGGKDIKVKPVMLMAMQEESTNWFGFGDESVVYKELDFDNPVKATAFNDALKTDKDLLSAKVRENAGAYEQRQDSIPVWSGLKVTSAPKKLYNYALHFNKDLDTKLEKIGIDDADINTKALLLSFALKTTQGQPETIINNIDKIFSLQNSPDFNDALKLGDMQLFLQTYADTLKGQDPSITDNEVNDFLADVSEFATAIRNTVIKTQKAQ